MYPLSLLFEVSAPFGPGECPLGVGVEVTGESGDHGLVCSDCSACNLAATDAAS